LVTSNQQAEQAVQAMFSRLPEAGAPVQNPSKFTPFGLARGLPRFLNLPHFSALFRATETAQSHKYN